MRSRCAHYLETLIRGQSYASTMCPVCAHYVSKPPPGKIDGATVHLVCAHYVAPRCPLYVNCFGTKSVCPKCAPDALNMQPLCAHYGHDMNAMGRH